MRRSRFAIVLSAAWIVGLSGVLITAIVSGPLVGLAAAMVVAGALTWGGIEFAQWSERTHRDQLMALSRALGMAPGKDALSFEAVQQALAARLERNVDCEAAFNALERPAIIATETGEILAASRGMRNIVPDAREGQPIDAVFGSGFLDAGGGFAEASLVALSGGRFEALTSRTAPGRIVIELVPEGHFVGDDDVDAFASALADGQTGFRFSDEACDRSPVLQAMAASLETLDDAAQLIRALIAGEPPAPELYSSSFGLAPLLRELVAETAAFAEAINTETSQRRAAEGKLRTVASLIDGYRSSASALAGTLKASHRDVDAVIAALNRGRKHGDAVIELDRDLLALAEDARKAANRTHVAAAGVDGAASQIDALISAVEDVSARTNVLALDAAMEAARAGEQGAGFAMVADEVRRLAQSSGRAARDIRALVGRARTEAETGLGESEGLKQLVVAIERRLRDLGDEAGQIGIALSGGNGALDQLEAGLAAVGGEAEKVLLLPTRKSRAGSNPGVVLLQRTGTEGR